MVLIAGIEEAGRGPVIGPLVMAGVLINKKDIIKLQNIGVKDSKLLSPEQRKKMFPKIKDIAEDYKIMIIGSSEVDSAVISKKLNLNKLEAIKSAEIINGLKPDTAYLDCPSNNIGKYVEFLKGHLKSFPEIIAEHKADLKYAVVSAASILAKVTRDEEIEKIKRKHNIDFGSGYPSDPKTVDFLSKNYKKYDFFRKSWESYRRVAEKSKQSSLSKF